MRTASSFGWYAFPAEEVSLRWNGVDVFVREDEQWRPLVRSELPGFSEYWNRHAPPELEDLAPPFLTRLPMPGFVQVWTGLLCSSSPGWSVLVRPPSNMRASFLYTAYEGIVETDHFKPCPLFMNIQLLATHTDIHLPKLVPLLQVQPLLRDSYGEAAHLSQEREGLGQQEDGEPALSVEDWHGYRRTIRIQADDEPPETGQYAAEARKRTKS